MRKFPLLIVAILIGSLISACSGSTSVSTPPANALYFDNFANTGSGWTRLQNELGSADYAKGYFHILINKASTLLISNPGKAFAGDVSIEVDARKIGGSDDNFFGVVCHYIDANNYYLFMITSDGYSGIAMRKDGVDTLISPGLKFLPMDGIKKGNATNHIRADCVGEQLTLYANGKQVNLAFDNSLTGGDVGLAVRSGKLEGGTDIRFDDFTVYQPAQP
jgi:hypothetical protein